MLFVNQLRLAIGESDLIQDYYLAPEKKIRWGSDCPDIASVSEYGKVTANRIGKTEITAVVGDDKCSVDVEVLQTRLYGSKDYTQSGDLDVAPEAEFAELHIYNKPDTEMVYVGQTYPVGAIPYPLNLYGDGTKNNIPNYAIDWVSSDESVATVKHGIIEPLVPGDVTIMAKIHGTEITDSFALTVEERPEIVEHFFDVSVDYAYDGHLMIGGTSADAMHAIYGAITEAKVNGFNGVKFPKMDIFIQPVQLEAFAIPSNFTVDFGFASVYVDSWHDYVNGTLADGTKGNAYCMFSFEGAEHSCIRNLYYYGEYYNSDHSASEYGEQTLFLEFSNGRYCEVYNCRFEGVVGFHIGVGFGLDKGGDYINNPSGTGDSRMLCSNFADGRLMADGKIKADNDCDWCYTVDPIPFNSEFYHQYMMGTAFYGYLGELFDRTRFYTIAFYDADGNLLEFDEWRTAYSSYTVPDGAVSYRASFPCGCPSEDRNVRSDICVERMMGGKTTYCCTVYNCEFYNHASGAVSGIGAAVNFRFFNNYIDWVGAKNAWCYDLEDGWYAMQSCVLKDNSYMVRLGIAGVLNAMIGNAGFRELYVKRSQNIVMVGNDSYDYYQQTEDINGVTDYTGTPTDSSLGNDFGRVNVV